MARRVDAQDEVTLSLNWPPSVNHYWNQRGQGGRYISAFGKAYREEVWVEFKRRYPGRKPLACRVGVRIFASPPDNVRRDLDNILKSILDSMQHAGVYQDDSQIDALEVYRTQEHHDAIHVIIWPLAHVPHETEMSPA